jgi:hypothetical protein
MIPGRVFRHLAGISKAPAERHDPARERVMPRSTQLSVSGSSQMRQRVGCPTCEFIAAG